MLSFFKLEKNRQAMYDLDMTMQELLYKVLDMTKTL